MLQDIIVYAILFAVAGYSVFAVIRSLRKKDESGCDGCDGCDMKKEIMKNCKSPKKASGTCGCG